MTIEFDILGKNYAIELLTEENAAPFFERFNLTPCPLWHLSDGDGFEFSILKISSNYQKTQESINKKSRFDFRSINNGGYFISGSVNSYKPFGHRNLLSFEQNIAVDQAVEILKDIDNKSYTYKKIESALSDHISRCAH